MTEVGRIWLRCRSLGRFIDNPKQLLRIIVFGAGIQGCGIFAPLFFRMIIDRALPHRDYSQMSILVVGGIGLIAGSAALQSLQTASQMVLSSEIHCHLLSRLYEHVQRFTIGFFDQTPSGAIVNRFTLIESALIDVLAFLQVVSINILYLVVVPILLIRTNALLGLCGLIGVPFIVYLTYRRSECVAVLSRLHADSRADLQAFQSEMFTSIRTVKAMRMEPTLSLCFRSLISDSECLSRHKTATVIRYGLLINGFKLISTASSMLIGWHLVFVGRLDIGHYLAFAAYLNYLYSPLSEVSGRLCSTHEAYVTLERAEEYLASPTEDILWLASPGKTAPENIGEVAFKDVSFAYEGNNPIIRNVSLSCSVGSITAIVGPTGCGKTTLLRLAVGFWRPLVGEISIGGLSLQMLPLSEIRRLIAVVWHDSGIFAGTLWNNLVAYSTDIPLARVEEIVDLCQLRSFVEGLPDRFLTRLSDGGVTVSAGQKQRIAIARAILKDSPVLLLDEATANLDTVTEDRLLCGLREYSRDKIIVIVTHRRSTATIADRVLRFSDGALKDVTKHYRLELPQAATS